ncbi:MAG TPA: hypothetical protein ENJ09_09215 [Planctomycetes bacterium]|nr:hypothetical protein [Planctomycetota bacterium]
MSSIPERRLFAFDLESGRELWNHAPPLAFDPASESFRPRGALGFAQRMLVAAPPTVAGDRVLVPCYRLEGRIDYHIACYELSTGKLLWSTGVVSGQRSRNMFGRALEEFSASPLVVSGDRVIAQTELGTVAALDLADGTILWESLYRQMALPKTAGYQLTSRPVTWRLAPPAVAGGVVISTPVDSAELTAFDLASGRVLWSLDQEMLARIGGDRRGVPFDCLVGVGRNAFFLGGGRVARFGVSGGLGGGGFPRLEWSVALDSAFASDRAARPVLCREAVLVPLPDQRLVLDRAEGRTLRSLTARWDFGSYGNAWVGRGRIFTLSATQVTGIFDWKVLVDGELELLERDPENIDTRIRAVSLLARRAESALERGETFAALNFLEESRRLLDPLLPAGETPSPRSAPRIAAALFDVLRAQARAHEAAGRPRDALDSLRLALPLAGTQEDVRDTLLATERNLERAGRSEERLEVLGELERRVASLPMPLSALTDSTSSGLPFSPGDGAVGTSAPPVGLWVLVTRAEMLRAERDFAGALADWHRILARYREVRLPSGERAAAFAEARIADTLRDPDGRLAFQPFEERARVLLDRALETQNAEELERLARCYPHSKAARDAEHARLELAFAQGDAAAVARLAYAARAGAPGGLRPDALLLLSRLIGRLGNEDFELAALRSLARANPEAVSPFEEDAGATLAELLARRERSKAVRTPRLPRFDARSEIALLRTGAFASVGHILAPDAAETDSSDIEIFLFDRAEPERNSPPHEGTHLLGFSSEDPTRVLFERSLESIVPSAAAGGRAADTGAQCIVVATEEELAGFDRRGTPLWTRPIGAPVVSLDIESGMVVVLQGSPSPFLLSAFEVRTGTALWRMELDASGAWRPPILGGGRAVLTSKPYGRPATARVVDLLVGNVTHELDLGSILEPRIETCAWIDDDRLFVPSFRRLGASPQGVTIHDLTGESPPQGVHLPDAEEFLAVVRHGKATFLVTSSVGVGSTGGIWRLDGEWAGLRRVLPLRGGETPIGIDRRSCTQLPTDELFTLFSSGDGRVTIRSIRLRSGASWSQAVPLVDLDPSRRPALPAVGEETVALVLPQRNPRSRLSGSGRLLFLDRFTGALRFSRPLSGSIATAERIELSGLGEALFLRGRGHRSRGWQLEILENRR